MGAGAEDTTRDELRHDVGFLRRWLEVLEALPRYGAGRDTANITMLRRLTDPVA